MNSSRHLIPTPAVCLVAATVMLATAQNASNAPIQFNTVRYPGDEAPRMEAIARGVRMSFANEATDEIILIQQRDKQSAPHL